MKHIVPQKRRVVSRCQRWCVVAKLGWGWVVEFLVKLGVFRIAVRFVSLFTNLPLSGLAIRKLRRCFQSRKSLPHVHTGDPSRAILQTFAPRDRNLIPTLFVHRHESQCWTPAIFRGHFMIVILRISDIGLLAFSLQNTKTLSCLCVW